MASLQTLRNKGGVIVAVIIGLALISFILGDLLTSSTTLFGSDRTAGEINGNDITIQQYTEKVNYLTDIHSVMTGSESQTSEQSEQISNQAWESFIREYAFLPDAQLIGLTASPDEVKELFYGQNPSPLIQQMFTNPETGFFDPQYLAAFSQNLGKDQTGRLQLFWNYLQSEVADQSVIYKYKTLVDKAAYTTATQAKFAAQLLSNNFNVQFVSQSYASIADSTVSVTDAELKDYYNTHKALFRINDSREVSYVLFEAIPSNQDYIDADKYISSLAAEFAMAQEPLQFAKANTQGQADERYYSQDELSGDLAAYAFGARNDSIYGPMLSGATYTLARIADTRPVPDTLDISQIVLATDNTKTADSLLTALNGGADFAQNAAQFSLDQQARTNGGKVGLIDPQTLPQMFSAELIDSKVGQIKKISLPQAIYLIKVNNVVGVKPRVKLARITYNVEPSEVTRNNTFNKASAFATTAGGSLANFNKAVSDSALAARVVNIAPNQRGVQGLADSREIVSWSFNKADKEQVSKVMTFGDNFVVAALSSIANVGFAPLDKVKADVTILLRQQKKGQLMADKFKGASNLETLAAQLGDSIHTANDVNFNTFVVPQIGMDPSFAGAICALTPNQLSKPIVGMQAVYLAKVTETIPNGTSPELEKQRLKAEAIQTAFMRSYQAFIDMCEIKDIRYKFY